MLISNVLNSEVLTLKLNLTSEGLAPVPECAASAVDPKSCLAATHALLDSLLIITEEFVQDMACTDLADTTDLGHQIRDFFEVALAPLQGWLDRDVLPFRLSYREDTEQVAQL